MDIKLLEKARDMRNKHKSVYTSLAFEYLYFVSANKQQMSYFQLPVERTTKTSTISDAKSKLSYLPSITKSNNLFGPFKHQDTTSPPFLLPLDVLYSTTRRKQRAV